MSILIGAKILISTLINNHLGGNSRKIVARNGDTAFIKKIFRYDINGKVFLQYFASTEENPYFLFMILPDEFVLIEEVLFESAA